MKENNASPPLIALLFEKQRLLDHKLLDRLEMAGWKHLTRAQSLVFGQLSEDCNSTSQIAERLGLSRQAVHRTVLELVDGGYLDVQDDPVDGRSKVISLTAKGKHIQKDARRIFDELEQSLLNQLGATKLAAFRNMLREEWAL